MHPVNFCYWLQGMFEITETDTLSAKQTQIIKNHLNLVFFHSIDPETYGEDSDVAQAIHDGSSVTIPAVVDLEEMEERIKEYADESARRHSANQRWREPPKLKC